MQISEKVHALKIDFQIPLAPGKMLDRFIYIYLITGRKIYLIDTGVKNSHIDIFNYINKLGRDEKEIDSIFLTHAHPDHIGSAKSIRQLTDCKIFANENEKDWIEDTDKQFRERPIPGFHELVDGPVNIDYLFTENEIIIPEENISLKILFTPGHSDGSTSYYYEEEKILFSGDAVLLPGELPIFTNIDKYFSSIDKIGNISNEILLSSWDSPKKGNEIKEILKSSSVYIKEIQQAVLKTAATIQDTSSLAFCSAVLNELGLSKIQPNPLLLRSFQSVLNN